MDNPQGKPESGVFIRGFDGQVAGTIRVEEADQAAKIGAQIYE